tara:strand:- start:30514 stop:30714 length:201 start_codon:yes stop_codon:yes gene_type:complete
VTTDEKDLLILEAAIEFGPDNLYEIKNGTLGQTLYIETPHKLEATYIRKTAPINWKGLYTVVVHRR